MKKFLFIVILSLSSLVRASQNYIVLGMNNFEGEYTGTNSNIAYGAMPGLRIGYLRQVHQFQYGLIYSQRSFDPVIGDEFSLTYFDIPFRYQVPLSEIVRCFFGAIISQNIHDDDVQDVHSMYYQIDLGINVAIRKNINLDLGYSHGLSEMSTDVMGAEIYLGLNIGL